MDKNVLISVAMTCYNQAQFIKTAIKSVVNQTHVNWELVIVDDCSTDNSFKLINKLVKKLKIKNKTKIIRNDKNMGYSRSLHRAIKEGSGELVAVLDSDDSLADNDAFTIEKNIHIKNPSASLVYSNYIICNKNLKPQRICKGRALEKGETFLRRKKRISISHLKMFKKKCYDMTDGINPDLQQTVDKDLVLRLEEVGNLIYVNKNLVNYRKHPTSLTATWKKKGPKYTAFVKKMRVQIFTDAKERRKIKNEK